MKFKLGHKVAREQDIEINLEDYLVNSADLGITQEKRGAAQKCYLPIFVANPGQDSNAYNVWWLGNMFMDRYFIINNSEGADPKADPPVYPLVGIYDKVNP